MSINERKRSPERSRQTWIVKLSIAAAHYYYALVFVWIVLHWTAGDRWWWLFLLNSFSEHLFLPIPLVLILALIVRRRDITLGFIALLVLWAFLFGGLMLPPIHLNRASGPEITVMTSNVLGYNMESQAVVDAIRASNADLVALQELNPQIAHAIRQDLSEVYPYQELVPQVGTCGLGVISRYPLQPVGVELEGVWVGGPQVLEMEWEGERILVINFHAIPPNPPTPSHLTFATQERERQVRGLIEFVESRAEPAVVLGDLNITAHNTAYEIMVSSLHDAWSEGGWGMGHTFPGRASPGTPRLSIGRLLSLRWLLRLDYVFYSQQWEVDKAWIGPWDGVSDHRPVVARLVLRRAEEGILP